MASLLEAFAPDVLHQHGQFFDLTWLTGWWARRHDVPVLLSVHTRLENPSRGLPRGLPQPRRRCWSGRAAAYRPEVVVMDAQTGLHHHPVRRCVRRAGAHPRRRGPRPALGGDGARVRARHDLGDAPLVSASGT